MLVDGLIFADERLIPQLRSDRAPEQVANVACLPGIQTASLAMPDIHWGYGFCIGGVCATDPLPPRAVEDIPNRKRSQRSGIGVAGGFIVTSCPEDSPVNGTFATVVRSVSCMWAQAGR
ncbi:MAG: hypothetical protein EBR86_09960 [Planctomycetia bacterium]|nr:hypothetical protein [Planctomycetia bacterium]